MAVHAVIVDPFKDIARLILAVTINAEYFFSPGALADIHSLQSLDKSFLYRRDAFK